MSNTDNDEDGESGLQAYEYEFEIMGENGNEIECADNSELAELKYQDRSDSFSAFSQWVNLAEDDIDFEFNPYDSDFELLKTEKINRIESLRIEQAALILRKDNALQTLTELYSKRMADPNVPINEGTPEELENYYENLVLKFRDKKIVWLWQEQKLKADLKLTAEYKLLERIKCDQFISDQYALELQIGLTMINPRTRKKLDRNVIQKMIDDCQEKHKRINILCTKQIRNNNAIRKIETAIKELLSNSTYNIQDYQQMSAEVIQLNMLQEKTNNHICNVRRIIIDTIKENPYFHQKVAELNQAKENKIFELKKLKDASILNFISNGVSNECDYTQQWKHNYVAEVFNKRKKLDLKTQMQVDWFADDSLLLKDYQMNMEKSQKNLVYEIELKQKIFEYGTTIKNYLALLKEIKTNYSE
ncbi:Hypothetical protein CINCED_3A025327 [Cinara cedri]|uniref:Uncharacterized protein n=1 Tax=Cinara cedri TaxID=506608 RepID=A0A5E4MRD2_9HEMI|nr:Hypothetical protein CINCED_3A025327 [Cinara cedri]